MPRPIIIAHRGASGTCPENTLLAFRRALEVGAEWLELDTQLVENELVVFHDDALDRTTNAQGLLSEISLADLRQLDAGQGEKIPFLHEVLTLAVGKAQVNVELKGVGTGKATAVYLKKMFAQGKLAASDVLASSLRLEELHCFQKLMPEVRRAPIYETLPSDFEAELKKFSCWSVHLHKSLITNRVIKMAAQQNSKVFAWTVNDLTEANHLARQGVAGFFTDIPERFIIREG